MQTGASVTVAESPFVKVLASSGIPNAAGIMNFVIISAALSGMNTNVYLCARMMFSLARGHYAPRWLGKLNRSGAPVGAVMLSGGFVLAATLLAKFTPRAYAYLQGVALFGAIIVWMIILLSHFRFRQAHKGMVLPVRMPFFPVMQIAGLLLLAALLVIMGLDKDWSLSWIVGAPWLILLTIAYFLWKRAALSAPAAETVVAPLAP
jgi:L-asparagine transporter-like permease